MPIARPDDPLAPFLPPGASLDPALEQVKRDLAARLPASLSVDVDACFPRLAGFGAARAREKRLDWLSRAAPVLERCLAPGDRITFVALAIEQRALDRLSAGHWAHLMNRVLVVTTGRGLVVMACDSKGAPSRYAYRSSFDAVRKVRRFLGNVTVSLKKGKRTFQIGRGDGKTLVERIRARGSEAEGGFELLCPACFAASSAHAERCASCGIELRSPRTAMLRSLLFPGLGTWYAGNNGLAVFQILRGALLWIVAIAAALTAGGGVAALFVGLALFFHVFDAMVSRSVAQRGLVALDGTLPSRSRA